MAGLLLLQARVVRWAITFCLLIIADAHRNTRASFLIVEITKLQDKHSRASQGNFYMIEQ